MDERPGIRLSTPELIPSDAPSAVRHAKVAGADWTAGPSYMIRHTRVFELPVPVR